MTRPCHYGCSAPCMHPKYAPDYTEALIAALRDICDNAEKSDIVEEDQDGWTERVQYPRVWNTIDKYRPLLLSCDPERPPARPQER